MIGMICPICEKGKMGKKTVDVIRHGIFVGHFKADVCNRCDEQIFDAGTARKIEHQMREIGLWMSEKATIYKIGGNFALSLASKLARSLGISKNSRPTIVPQLKERRFIVEF